MSQNLLVRLARGLDAADLSYMIIGGQAVLLYGEPRLTRDVDVTLGIAPDQLDRVLRVAGSVGLRVLVDDPTAFVERTWVLPTSPGAAGKGTAVSRPGHSGDTIWKAYREDQTTEGDHPRVEWHDSD